MEQQKYNGWTNYETWNVKLWLDNDEGSNNYWNERAQEIFNDSESDKTFTREENACNELADQLKSEIEENNPLNDEASLYSDILRANLSSVNWYEIAQAYIEEVDKEEE